MNRGGRNSAKGWPIWVASGGVNFFGQGWPYHLWLKALSDSVPPWLEWGRFVIPLLNPVFWMGAMRVFKTTTYYPQAGNMPLDPKTLMPTERFPKCIYVGWWQWLWGLGLNAVGLSGPGAEDLMSRGIWQRETEYFQLSFMAIGAKESWVHQWRAFLKLLAGRIGEFRSPFGIQMNVSCPNVRVGESQREVVRLALEMLAVLAEFPELDDIEIFVKIALSMSPAEATQIAGHPRCAGLVVTNTVPFGWPGLPRWKWRLWFPFSRRSPLTKFGGGGLSGAGLFPLLLDWLKEFRKLDPDSYVNAGGGVLRRKQVRILISAGANSVSIGSVAFLRWWRMKGIIAGAYEQASCEHD